MKIVLPSDIAKIDTYAVNALGVSEAALIRRAGAAIADAVCARFPLGEGLILVLAGGGNNGADGYSAACRLREKGYDVCAADVFSKGQRSAGGKEVLAEYRASVGEPLSFAQAERLRPTLILDAMFGTGFSGKAPEAALLAADFVRKTGARLFAVDVPFGVDAAWGELSESALFAEATFVLSFLKRGLLSYPAREACGELVLLDIGLDIPEVHAAFPRLSDDIAAALPRLLPQREINSHKGSFGKAMLFVGSAQYRGAAHLASEACLRGGAGLSLLASEKAVAETLLPALPEMIYKEIPPFFAFTKADIDTVAASAEWASAILVGSGSSQSAQLGEFLRALLSRKGAAVILDADAINSLAIEREKSLAALKNAKREVVLTPHPLELARLSGVSIGDIQKSRLRFASSFAKVYGVTLLLKGAGSVIAGKDGEAFVNTSGSSALAKGGTGDALAGFLTALLAQGAEPVAATRAAAYLHGRAADSLKEKYTEYGVLPSELPGQMAIELQKELKGK